MEILSQKNHKIQSLLDWATCCPPAGKSKHWVDGRSSKETAKIWLTGIPKSCSDILLPISTHIDTCIPEYNSRIDNYRGNGRNHDLLLINNKENVIIGIESKVDETFGVTISQRIIAAQKTKKVVLNSNALNRVEELRLAIFGKIEVKQENLRYQLLHSIAGVLVEAKKRNFDKAALLIQTIKTNKLNSKKYQSNQADLDSFIFYLTNGKVPFIINDILYNIGKVPGNDFIPNNIDLYIGKYEI